jgi:hypothetical protein
VLLRLSKVINRRKRLAGAMVKMFTIFLVFKAEETEPTELETAMDKYAISKIQIVSSA